MKITNNKMVFSENEHVICICKGMGYVTGIVKLLGLKYIIRLDKKYVNNSKLSWDYVVPFHSAFTDYLDDNNVDEQYELIKEHFYGILHNNGRQIK